jgi:K+-transporting ATPase KdpF subunit
MTAITMSLDAVVAMALAVLMLAYLVYSLLRPEQF